MPFTIDREASRMAKQAIDIDNMRERVKTTNSIYTFPSPSIYTIEKNLFYLLRFAKEEEFDSQYSMRPEYLSIDEYGTPALWELLMYVNNVFSKEEFILEKVVIPSFTSIVTICQDNFIKKKPSDLNEVNW